MCLRFFLTFLVATFVLIGGGSLVKADSIFSEKQLQVEPEASFLDSFISSTATPYPSPKRWDRFKSYEEYGMAPPPELLPAVSPAAPLPPADYYRQRDPFSNDRLRYVEDAFRPEEPGVSHPRHFQPD